MDKAKFDAGRIILDVPMQENDAGADTIGDYLILLAEGVWMGGESFSGKRPFGNSGWQGEVFYALVAEGQIEGEIDPEYGDILDYDKDHGRKLILMAFHALYHLNKELL